MLIGLLAACCCEADRQKIEYIYLHYGKIIFYVIDRIINDQKISEDLTHDLFVRLIEMADRIDLTDLKKLKSLLVILAKHTAIDYERKQKNAVTDENVSENLCGSLAEDSRKPDDKLGDAYTPIFQLTCLHGYSNPEIAKLLNIPSAKDVSNRVISGKRILMRMIGGDRYFENKSR